MEKYILMIEDNKAVVDSLLWLLKDYSIVVANNGYEAIKILESRNPLPSIILLDLMMPVMDGFIFRQTQRLNEKWSSIPTVIMSARADMKKIIEKLPHEILFTKPLDIQKLLGTIKVLIEGRINDTG